MFVVGIATVGVVHQIGWMANSPGPMVEGGIHSAARRAGSSNYLKQLVLATHNWIDAHNNNELPPGYSVDSLGRPLHGWPMHLLPYLEYGMVHSRIDSSRPWDDPVNRAAITEVIRPFVNPYFKDTESDQSGRALIHYAGNSYALPPKQGLKLPADFKDGTANTFLYGEVSAGFRPWGDPANLRDPERGIRPSAKSFAGPWSSGTLFAMADGSVRIVSNSISRETLKAAATPAAGDQLGLDW
jgi:hypothetical protein